MQYHLVHGRLRHVGLNLCGHFWCQLMCKRIVLSHLDKHVLSLELCLWGTFWKFRCGLEVVTREDWPFLDWKRTESDFGSFDLCIKFLEWKWTSASKLYNYVWNGLFTYDIHEIIFWPIYVYSKLNRNPKRASHIRHAYLSCFHSIKAHAT